MSPGWGWSVWSLCIPTIDAGVALNGFISKVPENSFGHWWAVGRSHCDMSISELLIK